MLDTFSAIAKFTLQIHVLFSQSDASVAVFMPNFLHKVT